MVPVFLFEVKSLIFISFFPAFFFLFYSVPSGISSRSFRLFTLLSKSFKKRTYVRCTTLSYKWINAPLSSYINVDIVQ